MCIPATVVGGLACSLLHNDLTYADTVTYCSESVLFLSNQPHVGPGTMASILQGLLRGCVKIVFKLQQQYATSWECPRTMTDSKRRGITQLNCANHFSAFTPFIGGEQPPMAVVDVCLVSICLLIESHGPVLQSTKSLTVDMLRDISNEVSVVSESYGDNLILQSVKYILILAVLLIIYTFSCIAFFPSPVSDIRLGGMSKRFGNTAVRRYDCNYSNAIF